MKYFSTEHTRHYCNVIHTTYLPWITLLRRVALVNPLFSTHNIPKTSFIFVHLLLPTARDITAICCLRHFCYLLQTTSPRRIALVNPCLSQATCTRHLRVCTFFSTDFTEHYCIMLLPTSPLPTFK